MSTRLVLTLVIVVLAACRGNGALGHADAPPGVTVSGLSSGGYMAGQLQLAHSDIVTGVAVLAAGPYDCAEGNILRALGPCVSGDGVDPGSSIDRARAAAADGGLADLGNLAQTRVWLFHGSEDSVVDARLTAAAESVYRALGVADAALVAVTDVPAQHGMPALDGAVPCAEMRAPFLNDCGYDAAGRLLQHLLGRTADAAADATGELSRFDQRGMPGSGLAETGFVYRPPQCADGDCGLHIVLHGCGQSANDVGDALARSAGFNRWADALDLVIVYPQVAADPAVNPLGCWDWWGYTGGGYATRDGAQVASLLALIERHRQGTL